MLSTAWLSLIQSHHFNPHHDRTWEDSKVFPYTIAWVTVSPTITLNTYISLYRLSPFVYWPGIEYCYLEFKLRYLKSLKLFSIRVKRIIWAYSFTKKANSFCLFFAFSWEVDLWVGDFRVQKCKIGKKNLYVIKNQYNKLLQRYVSLKKCRKWF